MRTAALAAFCSLAVGATAFAQDCGQSPLRLAEGDWAGTYQKEISLRGTSVNTRIDYKFHGTIRLHVNDSGAVETLQGELVTDISHSANTDGASGTSESGFSTPLILAGEPSSSQHFRAVGSASLSTHDTVSGPHGKGNFDYSISGRTQLDFHLLAATCDRGSGTFDSPLFRGIRDMASSNQLAITSDTPGTWTATDAGGPAEPKQIRARISP